MNSELGGAVKDSFESSRAERTRGGVWVVVVREHGMTSEEGIRWKIIRCQGERKREDRLMTDNALDK